MRFVSRLLPLIVLLAFGTFITGPAKPAQAVLGTLTVSTPTAAMGQVVTVTGNLANVGSATVTLTATSGLFLNGNVNTGEPVVGGGTSTMSYIGAASSGLATITTQYVCQSLGSVTITLMQTPSAATGPTTLTATVQCVALGVTPSTQTTSIASALYGTCATAGQLVSAAGSGAFSTFPSPVNINVTSPTAASCIAPGSFSVSYACSVDGVVTFSQGGNIATLTCNGSIYPYTPTNQICPMYNAVAPFTGGIPYPGAAPYSGTPFSFNTNGSYAPSVNNGAYNPYPYAGVPAGGVPYGGVPYGGIPNAYNGTGLPLNGSPYPYGVGGSSNPYNNPYVLPASPTTPYGPLTACPPNPATQLLVSPARPRLAAAARTS